MTLQKLYRTIPNSRQPQPNWVSLVYPWVFMKRDLTVESYDSIQYGWEHAFAQPTSSPGGMSPLLIRLASSLDIPAR